MANSNILATQHYLSINDINFFKNKVQEINKRILRIIEENNLQGNWTLSQDYKWLIKTED